MPKLILKFDDRELPECAVGTHPVSIGRLPDNNIVIDNPAVSGRHARVYREGNHYVLEDLKSTNGTFVNDKPIARHTLLEGDVVARRQAHAAVHAAGRRAGRRRRRQRRSCRRSAARGCSTRMKQKQLLGTRSRPLVAGLRRGRAEDRDPDRARPHRHVKVVSGNTGNPNTCSPR